jgi:hypothetical protein
LDHLLRGLGPFEKEVLFKKILARTFKFFGVSRKGQEAFFQICFREFPPPPQQGTKGAGTTNNLNGKETGE